MQIWRFHDWERRGASATLPAVTSPQEETTSAEQGTPPPPGGRVPIEQLVDLEALALPGRQATPARIRAALPAGWILDADARTAHRDLRVLARDGWVLVLGLVCFGAAGLGLFYSTFPTGWRGIGRFVILIVVVIGMGGIVGPMITRALMRKPK
ncbi:MAG: hypothetical protein ACI8QC_003826 [Planctomycetota bacterium]|jgi:hypothetical protein